MPTEFSFDEIVLMVNGQALPEGKLVPAKMEPEILTFDEMQKARERLETYAFGCDLGYEISFSTQLPGWKMARLKNMGWKKRRRWQPVQWILRHDGGLYARRIVKGYDGAWHR